MQINEGFATLENISVIIVKALQISNIQKDIYYSLFSYSEI